MNMRNKHVRILAIAGYFVFLVVSFMTGFRPGKEIGHNFLAFTLEMLKILPCAFVLIGLFEVWVKRESVERHLGKGSGALGYLWVILLAGTTVGGLYLAFPVAYSLFKKGASLSYIFTYIGSAAVCRIPMTIFEASFLGLEFSLVRLAVSIPLVVFSSILLGNYLEKRNFEISEGS